MDTPEKPPEPRPTPEALFRYQLVSQVLTCLLGGGARAECVGQVACQAHLTLDGIERTVSERTLRRWVAAFEATRLRGLERAQRPALDKGVVPEALLRFVAAQKQLDPRASLPEILERARERKIIDPSLRICRSSLWRAAKRRGIHVRRRRYPSKERDARRFAYRHRMRMLLCDGKHFRAGAARARRVALFFLDDATRRALHVVVGTSECTELFLRGLYEVIARYGFPGACFLDNGPGFIAGDTIAVFGALQVPLIHGTARYPEGHGKIEAFNKTAKAKILRGLDGRADVDPACGALELRLAHYLETRYNHAPHSALGDQSPAARFMADPTPLRPADSDQDLRRCFVIRLERTVSADHVVSIDSTAFEVPRGVRKQRIVIEKRLLEGSYHVVHNGRLVRIHPVDLDANARSRRGREEPNDEPTSPLPRSAADLAFERDFPPLLDDDGGFSGPDDDTEAEE